MKAFKDQRAGNKEEKGKDGRQAGGNASEGATTWNSAGLVFTSIATQNAREKGGRGPEGGGSPS